MLSILAGVVIGIGAIINLNVGGVAGAVFFAIGLLAVLTFKLELFTGKAGLLATNEITGRKLLKIWIGNFIGAGGLALLYSTALTPSTEAAIAKATSIVALRLANGPLANCIYGILCGVLMFIAVNGYKETKNPIIPVMGVAGFILGGFNHCVADMFYVSLGLMNLSDLWVLIPTTLGNLIGCCLIPAGIRYYY